jgi:hypothetical protein
MNSARLRRTDDGDAIPLLWREQIRIAAEQCVRADIEVHRRFLASNTRCCSLALSSEASQ